MEIKSGKYPHIKSDTPDVGASVQYRNKVDETFKNGSPPEELYKNRNKFNKTYRKLEKDCSSNELFNKN